MKRLLDYKFFRKSLVLMTRSFFHPISDLFKIVAYELRRKFRDTPLFIAIETTTICNLKCSYCPSEKIMKQRPALMQETVIKNIINDISKSFPGYNKQIQLQFYGEPLTDKRIFKLIEFTRLQVQAAKIVFFTNGELLSLEKYELLKDKGVNRFIITQHKASIPHLMKDWFSKRKHRDIRYQVAGSEMALFNRGGSQEISNPARIKYCHYAPYGMIFNSEGNLVACCNDPFSSQIFGNYLEGLRTLWEKPAYKKFRRQVLKGKFSLPICNSCTGK